MAEPIHDAQRLLELQSLPLERKIQITQARIIEWYQHFKGNVCVSFSGGKDSTVLLHIARQIYPNIPAVFSNTGLEYASIQQFVRTWDNVDIVVPKMKFNEVLTQFGYPLIGKEVAEAIYYARRIRSQSVNVERERERERRRNNLQGQPVQVTENERKYWGNEQTDDSVRNVVPGKRETTKKRIEIKGEHTNYSPEKKNGTQRTGGSKWESWYRRCLDPDETDPKDRECFWNRKGDKTEWSDWRRRCL